MAIKDTVTDMLDLNWTLTNSFTVYIDLDVRRNMLFPAISNLKEACVINVKTPDFSADPVDHFTMNRWFPNIGRSAMARFTITFRDYERFELYSQFVLLYRYCQSNYPDDAMFSVSIAKPDDWGDKSSINVFKYHKCIVDGVSNIDLNSSSEGQIAEFMVSFKCQRTEMVQIEKALKASQNMNFFDFF